MIKAILIDDEAHCLDTLDMLIEDHCKDMIVADRCMSGREALESVQKVKPDIVFLDIEMPSMNGFEFLEQFEVISFSIIFTTSYNQYAIKAIRFSALDYLLKPIDPKELVAAVEKIRRKNIPPAIEQFRLLMDNMRGTNHNFTKVAVPTLEGFELIPVDQIIRCEADDNYSHFYLKSSAKVTACRTLKEMEEQFQHFDSFVRVHNSHLVNLNEVARYVRGEGGYLVMNDGSTVSVSRSRKELLLKKIQPQKN